MFTSLAVVLGDVGDRERTLPVVRSLSELGGVPLELVTVASASSRHNAGAADETASPPGWPAHSRLVLYGDDVARAIVDLLEGHDASLLVMATSAKKALRPHHERGVAAGVLAGTDRPVLLIGPRVPEQVDMSCPTLIVTADATNRAELAIPAVVSWVRTFPGGEPAVVEVIATVHDPGADRRTGTHVRDLAAQLERAGVHASSHVLHGGDPVFWLEDFASGVCGAVFVATSARWSDDQWHWSSTTRRLVQLSGHPVLVVPDHPRPVRHAS